MVTACRASAHIGLWYWNEVSWNLFWDKGARLPFALLVGYPLHGLWDLLHELHAHGAYSAFEPSQLTAIPLAYGVFCAAFDLCMAAYFYARRAEWNTAWKAVPQS
jgi:hypothetical protein